MMNLKRLDNLYPTMTDLAAYLLLAHEKHARYILGQPDSRQPAAVVDCVRLTYDYVRALLACGIPPEAAPVQEATTWFDVRFSGAFDQIELLRLEALLHLRPGSAGVKVRLERLLEHRLPNNGLFEIERNSILSDTLAALRVLLLARDRKLLDERISSAEIEQTIDRIRDMLSDDGDQALLLRLRHQLTGKLDSDLLEYLLGQAREHNAVWGMRRKYVSPQMKNIIQAMHRQRLSSAEIRDQAAAFSEVILNTCTVIEHLTSAASDHERARAVLETSMALWWSQLQGDQAPARLRALFPDEADFLRLLCWTVIAVRAYAGEPLGRHLLTHALAAAAGRFKEVEWAEKADIETALRQWIGVELPENAVKLKLGLSDSNVVRIAPRLFHPLTGREMNAPDETLVVKYGPVDEVDRERTNYHALPAAVQRFFVKIPDRAYTNERQAFVIMEDLAGYFTLYEICKDLLVQDNDFLGRQLSDFLIEMHGSAGSTGIASSVHLHELYIRPILEQVGFIFARVQDLARSGLMPRDPTFDGHEVLYDRVSDQLGVILRHQRAIERFPTAFMHGDLHSRNIMIGWDRHLRHSADRFAFKLIDLSNLRRDGDIAHDAGQILVDLETLPLRDDFTDRRVLEWLDDLLRGLENHYTHYAFDRAGDDTFSMRLNLGRARARIRIAKSRAKLGGKHLNLQAHSEAVAHISESLQFVEWAAHDLEAICQEII